jgi:hypothetical protein
MTFLSREPRPGLPDSAGVGDPDVPQLSAAATDKRKATHLTSMAAVYHRDFVLRKS